MAGPGMTVEELARHLRSELAGIEPSGFGAQQQSLAQGSAVLLGALAVAVGREVSSRSLEEDALPAGLLLHPRAHRADEVGGVLEHHCLARRRMGREVDHRCDRLAFQAIEANHRQLRVDRLGGETGVAVAVEVDIGPRRADLGRRRRLGGAGDHGGDLVVQAYQVLGGRRRLLQLEAGAVVGMGADDEEMLHPRLHERLLADRCHRLPRRGAAQIEPYQRQLLSAGLEHHGRR